MEEGGGDLPYGGEAALSPDQADGVVLPHVLAGDEGELRRARGRRYLVVLSPPDSGDHVSLRGADERQEGVGLLRRTQDHLLALYGVQHFELEPPHHAWVDHQARGVEGVREDPVEEVVVGRRLRLVGGVDDHGVTSPLLELHLGDAGPHALHVAAEGVDQEVLACAV